MPLFSAHSMSVPLTHSGPLSTLIAFGALLTSSPAAADWQYTRWGDTPEAVTNAASGAARANDDRGKDPLPNRALLTAPYEGLGFAFPLGFTITSEFLNDPKAPQSCPCRSFARFRGGMYHPSYLHVPTPWRVVSFDRTSRQTPVAAHTLARTNLTGRQRGATRTGRMAGMVANKEGHND